MSAPGQDAAQPTGTAPTDGQGQGQDRAFSSILGEDAFSNAPEELRPHLEEYVRTQVDPRLTQRFQEAAQFRSTWEPYSQVEGLTGLDPQDVDQLVEFGYTVAAATDENHPQREQAVQALQETWEQLGEQFGFFGDDVEEDDQDGGEDDQPQYMTREEFEAELARRDQQSQIQTSTAEIQQQLSEMVAGLELPGKPGSEEREAAEADVFTFMQRYVDDPDITDEQMVQSAFEDYQRLTGGAQRRLLEDQDEIDGGMTIHGGGADTSPEEVKSFKDADKLARARLTGAMR